MTSLATVLEHAKAQRDAGVAALLQAEDQAARAEAQALQLAGYHEETLARHPAHGGRAAGIEMLRVHLGFVQRLQQAIAQQQRQVQQTHGRVAQLRGELLALQTRVASVEKLLERRDAEARQREAQREQRRSDDARRPAPSTEHGSLRVWRTTTQAVPL